MNAAVTRLFKGRRNQTILDQLIVSGSNFATTILLVRGLGLQKFGIFAIVYALILLANNVQLSFICSPMITLAALSEAGAPRTRYLRGMFGVQLWFCGVVMVVAAFGGAIYLRFKGVSGEAGLLPAFLVSLVAFLMQDWLRRYYFAAGKAQHSIWNDLISYLGQALLLLGLLYYHQMTVNIALWSIAGTSGLAYVLGQSIERLSFTRLESQAAWQQSRKLSRDLAIASQLQWFVYQGAMLLGAGILGAEAAGSVRATQNVVGPINVAYQAMENIVPLRAGEEMRKGGIRRLVAFLVRFGAKGLIALSLVFLSIVFVAKPFLILCYGRGVGIYAGVLDLQMLYFLLLWPLRQLNYLFRTIERTSSILISSFVAAATSLLLLYACSMPWASWWRRWRARPRTFSG
jgi:O-antigen/teichoic acid export membrane protein